MKPRAKRVGNGHYFYRGYDVYSVGYFEPEHHVVWEAVDPETGCADYRGYSLRDVKQAIDEEFILFSEFS